MRLFDLVSAVVACLVDIAAFVARCLWQTVLAVSIGVVSNDVWQLAPRMARSVVRWSSRCRYGQTERARIRAEEHTRAIDDLPGNTLKLVVAARFAGAALPIGTARLARVAVFRLAKSMPRTRRRLRQADGVVVACVGPADARVRVTNSNSAPSQVLPTAADWTGTARLVLAGSGGIACFVGLLLASSLMYFNAGADIDITYASGDRPSASAPPPCMRAACGLTLPEDDWTIAAGSSITTSYTSAAGRDVDTLAGSLAVVARCDVRVSWSISADGQPIAHGVLVDLENIRLTSVEIPTGRTPGSLSLTARRLDSNDCTADLTWRTPGYEAPGFLPPFV